MKRLTTEDFTKRSNIIHNNTYDYSLVVYSTSMVKVDIMCGIHGLFTQTPNDHMNGKYGCPRCGQEKTVKDRRSNTHQFTIKANSIHHNMYDYSAVAYTNAISKVDIRCAKHGMFRQTPDKHLGGTRCPKCANSTSHGERITMRWLDTMNITYEREKRFPDLHGNTKNSRLRCDFWLPKYNTLIEYDGEQHTKPINIEGRLSEREAMITHQKTKVNDIKKNAYAIINGYRLLRIPHTSCIDDVLDEYFTQFSSDFDGSIQ